MKQEESKKFCHTLDMIGDYLKKALQGSKFRLFCNIILGIHEDDVPACNTSGRAFLEEWKLKLKKDKEESQKADKIAGD